MSADRSARIHQMLEMFKDKRQRWLKEQKFTILPQAPASLHRKNFKIDEEKKEGKTEIKSLNYVDEEDAKPVEKKLTRKILLTDAQLANSNFRFLPSAANFFTSEILPFLDNDIKVLNGLTLSCKSLRHVFKNHLEEAYLKKNAARIVNEALGVIEEKKNPRENDLLLQAKKLLSENKIDKTANLLADFFYQLSIDQAKNIDAICELLSADVLLIRNNRTGISCGFESEQDRAALSRISHWSRNCDDIAETLSANKMTVPDRLDVGSVRKKHPTIQINHESERYDYLVWARNILHYYIYNAHRHYIGLYKIATLLEPNAYPVAYLRIGCSYSSFQEAEWYFEMSYHLALKLNQLENCAAVISTLNLHDPIANIVPRYPITIDQVLKFTVYGLYLYQFIPESKNHLDARAANARKDLIISLLQLITRIQEPNILTEQQLQTTTKLLEEFAVLKEWDVGHSNSIFVEFCRTFGQFFYKKRRYKDAMISYTLAKDSFHVEVITSRLFDGRIKVEPETKIVGYECSAKLRPHLEQSCQREIALITQGAIKEASDYKVAVAKAVTQDDLLFVEMAFIYAARFQGMEFLPKALDVLKGKKEIRTHEFLSAKHAEEFILRLEETFNQIVSVDPMLDFEMRLIFAKICSELGMCSHARYQKILRSIQASLTFQADLIYVTTQVWFALNQDYSRSIFITHITQVFSAEAERKQEHQEIVNFSQFSLFIALTRIATAAIEDKNSQGFFVDCVKVLPPTLRTYLTQLDLETRAARAIRKCSDENVLLLPLINRCIQHIEILLSVLSGIGSCESGAYKKHVETMLDNDMSICSLHFKRKRLREYFGYARFLLLKLEYAKTESEPTQSVIILKILNKIFKVNPSFFSAWMKEVYSFIEFLSVDNERLALNYLKFLLELSFDKTIIQAWFDKFGNNIYPKKIINIYENNRFSAQIREIHTSVVRIDWIQANNGHYYKQLLTDASRHTVNLVESCMQNIEIDRTEYFNLESLALDRFNQNALILCCYREARMRGAWNTVLGRAESGRQQLSKVAKQNNPFAVFLLIKIYLNDFNEKFKKLSVTDCLDSFKKILQYAKHFNRLMAITELSDFYNIPKPLLNRGAETIANAMMNAISLIINKHKESIDHLELQELQHEQNFLKLRFCPVATEITSQTTMLKLLGTPSSSKTIPPKSAAEEKTFYEPVFKKIVNTPTKSSVPIFRCAASHRGPHC